jgi:hypothetical protein
VPVFLPGLAVAPGEIDLVEIEPLRRKKDRDQANPEEIKELEAIEARV